MAISRREFCEHLAAGGGLIAGGDPLIESFGLKITNNQTPEATGSHIGNLYPFVQKQADRSPLSLSFLRSEFKNLNQWQGQARTKLFELLAYTPPVVDPQPQWIRKTDRGDYIEEYLTFQTTPDLRVPAYLLIPKKAKLPAPGIVVLHSHDGIYLWGKEKVVESRADEHPYLTSFKRQRYGGKGIAAELARQGYVAIAIDMFYWGERRMLLDDDPQKILLILSISIGGETMKAYVITTGCIFALLVVVHIWRIIEEGVALAKNPIYIITTVLAAALCFWAWRVFRLIPRSKSS